jgi:hypothetical protein
MSDWSAEMDDDQRRRLASAEAAITQLRVDVAKLGEQMERNTEATRSVKCDTAEIVALMKGFRVLAMVAKGIAAIAALWATWQAGWWGGKS